MALHPYRPPLNHYTPTFTARACACGLCQHADPPRLRRHACCPSLQAGPLPMFTSCCPGWVNYVEKTQPELLAHLSTAKSPQQMFGAVVKTYWAQKAGVKVCGCGGWVGARSRPTGHKAGWGGGGEVGPPWGQLGGGGGGPGQLATGPDWSQKGSVKVWELKWP